MIKNEAILWTLWLLYLCDVNGGNNHPKENDKDETSEDLCEYAKPKNL